MRERPPPQKHCGSMPLRCKKMAKVVVGDLSARSWRRAKTNKCREKHGSESYADLLPRVAMGVYGRRYVDALTAAQKTETASEWEMTDTIRQTKKPETSGASKTSESA